MIFVANGYDVYLYDIAAKHVDKAIDSIREQIEKMAKDNVLRGPLNVEQQLGHIYKAKTLKECIDGAIHVQVKFQFIILLINIIIKIYILGMCL